MQVVTSGNYVKKLDRHKSKEQMYFDGVNYIHSYGCISRSNVMESIKNLYEDATFSRKGRGWLKLLLSNDFAKMNKSFFALVRKDLQLRIKHFTAITKRSELINPYLALYLLYTEFIPYDEVISELYSDKRIIEMFCMVFNRNSMTSIDVIAILMLGFDKYLSKPKIISNLIGSCGRMFKDEFRYTLRINEVGRILPMRIFVNEDSPFDNYSHIESLSENGTNALELFTFIFTRYGINLELLMHTKYFVCDDTPGKFDGTNMRISFAFDSVGRNWVTEDMACVKEVMHRNVCCGSCGKYVKLLKIRNVYLMTQSLFGMLYHNHVSIDVSEIHKSECLEEIYFDSLLDQELKEIQDLQDIENQLGEYLVTHKSDSLLDLQDIENQLGICEKL